MRNAVAFANNDVVTIAWSFGSVRITAWASPCTGLMLRVKKPFCQAMPSSKAKLLRTSDYGEFPVQKFYWKDPYARLVGEKTNSFTFRYKIVPLEGTPAS